MSKKYIVRMDDYVINQINKTSIRSKIDLIKLLHTIIQPLISVEFDQYNIGRINEKCIIIVVSKMNRIFINTDINRKVSFAFPFKVEVKENRIIFETQKYNIIIDHHILVLMSNVIREYENRGNKTIYDVIESEVENEFMQSVLIHLFEELLEIEDGYLRYDRDVDNQKDDYHPLFHIDINYSEKGTFKIGYRNEKSIENIMRLVDRNEKCSYFQD